MSDRVVPSFRLACALCGETLAEAVTSETASALFERHRKQAHPDLPPIEKRERHKTIGEIGRARGQDVRRRVLERMGDDWHTVTDLAEACGVQKSTMHERLKKLLIEGLVERDASVKPHRFKRVSDGGRARVSASPPRRNI